MRWKVSLICVGLSGGVPGALAQGGPSQAAVDEVVRLGTMATLAPVCGLRVEAWAFDLRRAAILEATRGEDPEDPALKSAPGSDLVVGALAFAEAEALESFAEDEPAETCDKLARGPGMRRADELVQRLRKLKSSLKPSS